MGGLEEDRRKRVLRSDGNDATPPEDHAAWAEALNAAGGERRWQPQSPSAPLLEAQKRRVGIAGCDRVRKKFAAACGAQRCVRR